MPPLERLHDRGSRRAARALADLGEEFRRARLELGLSQRQVALAARFDRADYSRLETAKLPNVPYAVLSRVGAVLGLDVPLRAFPAGRSIRDVSQSRGLQGLLGFVGTPLSYRTEVPLPRTSERPEARAWDALILGRGERTAVEYESRIHDFQAQRRRYQLKLRDDPVEHFLLVVADTRANRRAVMDFGDLAPDVPRLRTATILCHAQGRPPSSHWHDPAWFVRGLCSKRWFEPREALWE